MMEEAQQKQKPVRVLCHLYNYKNKAWVNCPTILYHLHFCLTCMYIQKWDLEITHGVCMYVGGGVGDVCDLSLWTRYLKFYKGYFNET